jgi:hypothetical protein
MTAVYVTVEYFGKLPRASRTLCEGCTPSEVEGKPTPAFVPERAEYRLLGASGAIALCRS